MISIRLQGAANARLAIVSAQQRIPTALSRAINNSAFKVREDIQKEMAGKIDRPTPWILRQLRVDKSSPGKLRARVGSQQWIANGTAGVFDKVLSAHVVGGGRTLKPVEQQLQLKGWMPNGWIAVPGHGVQLNQYGNLSRAMWRKLVQWKVAGDLFLVMPGDRRAKRMPPGIYKKTKSKHKGLILYFPKVSYRINIRWRDVATSSVNSSISTEFHKALQSIVSR